MMMLTMAKFVPQSPAPPWQAARHIGHCQVRRCDTPRQVRDEGQGEGQLRAGPVRCHTASPLEGYTRRALFREPWTVPTGCGRLGFRGKRPNAALLLCRENPGGVRSHGSLNLRDDQKRLRLTQARPEQSVDDNSGAMASAHLHACTHS